MKGGGWPNGRSTPKQGGTTKRVKPSSLTADGDEGFCFFEGDILIEVDQNGFSARPQSAKWRGAHFLVRRAVKRDEHKAENHFHQPERTEEVTR
jgi:hypothetical protein